MQKFILDGELCGCSRPVLRYFEVDVVEKTTGAMSEIRTGHIAE